MNIKKSREKLGITQEHLADLFGVTTRTIRNWETGYTIPSHAEEKLLKEILNARI